MTLLEMTPQRRARLLAIHRPVVCTVTEDVDGLCCPDCGQPGVTDVTVTGRVRLTCLAVGCVEMGRPVSVEGAGR